MTAIDRRHSTPRRRKHARHGPRALVAGSILAVVAGTCVIAQDLGDFIDPLDDVRVQAQQQESGAQGPETSPAPRLREGSDDERPTIDSLRGDAGEQIRQATQTANSTATSAWERVRKQVSDAAASFGLPVGGLLALLGLALVGLAIILGRLLFRNGPKPPRNGTDLYASGRRTERRRTLDETPKQRRNEKVAAVSDEASAQVDPKDPSTWKRPDLGRLRSSIREDWQAAKRESTSKHGGAQSKADRSLDEMLTRETLPPVAANAPEDRPLTQVAGGWDEWDASLDDDQDVWGERSVPHDSGAGTRVTAEEALRRVRALRDSLAVS